MSLEAVGESLERTTLEIVTETELAALRESEGATIRHKSGRLWEEIFPGFYSPVNLLARLTTAQIRRPSPLCWGYRAALVDADAGHANGSIPVHMLSIADGFTEKALNRNRRTDLRKCRETAEFARLRNSRVLAEQGYAVFQSAMERVAYWRPLSESEYLAEMGKAASDDRWFIIAGMVEGRLGGYVKTLAVDGVLYMYDIIVASEYLDAGLSTGLYMEAIQASVRTGEVEDICAGLHTPENDGLCQFKKGMGFDVVHVPAISAIPRPISAFIKARRPSVHYRLTGIRPAAA